MFGLELKTFDRDAIARLADPHDAEARAASDYLVRTYLGMRLALGVLGIALPFLLVVVDWALIEARVRGSMSAYYHSSSRDLFVGGLVVTGGFLVTYMSARKRSYDYVISTVAGVAVILVAAFPTGRELDEPGFDPTATSCAAEAGPPACSAVQQTFGEHVAETVHLLAAGVFVLMLVALCLVFALREFGYGPSARQLCGDARDVRCVRAAVRARGVPLLTYLVHGLPGVGAPLLGEQDVQPPRRRVLLYLGLAVLVLLGGAWAVAGPDVTVPGVGVLGSTYVGEVVAFGSFGVAWLAASKDLRPVQRAVATFRRSVLRQPA